MTTVRDYALEQMHWILRKDPWLQAILRAGGGRLDPLAEQVLAIWNQDNFSALNEAQCTYYERLLGLASGDGKLLADRRSAIEAKWKSATPPTLAMVQAVADSWRAGEITAEYDYETMTLAMNFSSIIGVPHDLDGLKAAIERFIPAHLNISWNYVYLTIAEVQAKTLAQMQALQLNNFAGGG